MSVTLETGRALIGEWITVVIDRPIGSNHPTAGFEYLVNYGYVPGTLAPDGEELDAYVLGLSEPVDTASGRCVAVVHREYEDDDKLVLVADDLDRSDEDILGLVAFQEAHARHRIVRE